MFGVFSGRDGRAVTADVVDMLGADFADGSYAAFWGGGAGGGAKQSSHITPPTHSHHPFSSSSCDNPSLVRVARNIACNESVTDCYCSGSRTCALSNLTFICSCTPRTGTFQ
jgi:hypothetical protein